MVSRYEHFTTAISSIYQNFQKIERDEMERYGLRGSYTQYLLAIERTPDGITAAQLCDCCEKDKAAVSRAVTEMEGQGLLCRELNNERAYRARLFLTEKGKNAAEFVRMRSQVAVDLASAGVSDADRAVMYAALEIIAGNLQRIYREGIPMSGEGYDSESETDK